MEEEGGDRPPAVRESGAGGQRLGVHFAGPAPELYAGDRVRVQGPGSSAA
jgi:hypothetical protein